MTDLERFKGMVNTQWAVEVGSLALKDLTEKAALKPKLLPITENIIKLVKLVEEKAKDASEQLMANKNVVSYKVLAETVLVLTILHNRKRVGDVQYLEWESYKQQIDSPNTILESGLSFSLTEKEKILAQNYKRIISIGKGSKPNYFDSKKNSKVLHNVVEASQRIMVF